MKRSALLLLICILVSVGDGSCLAADTATVTTGIDDQWVDPTGDGAGRRFSPLDQINAGNVSRLKRAWTYRTGQAGRMDKWGMYSLQTTPILVAGNLVGCTRLLEVFAVDPETGQERWRYDPEIAPAEGSIQRRKCRGVVAWTDPQAAADAPCKTRILHAADVSVVALDARSGALCRDFGRDGVVSVEISGLDYRDEVLMRGPGAIVNDLVIFGSAVEDAYRHNSPSGKVRAYDIRTGALRWEYDPIPRDPADPAYASWGADSAKTAGAANVWSRVSVDAANNLVFLPTTSPSNDYYGGMRPGDNRWSNSVVALNATTGEQVWTFQTVHHDIWDRDLPTQPILVDIEKDGVKIPALVQLTKQSYVFVLNRLTGEPIYPVEERPVPQDTDVAGEQLSPTQPFPTVIPPLSPTSLTPDDAWGFTPLDRYACRKKIEQYRSGPQYTPLSLRGTIVMPGTAGGANWGGGAVDAKRNIMVVPTTAFPLIMKIVPHPPGGFKAKKGQVNFAMKDSPYSAEYVFLLSPLGAPCSPPPWARLTAVDLNTGQVKWMVPLGSIEKQAWYAPPLMLGTPISGGAIVTGGGLVFIGATTDHKFRAFDLNTGKILWTEKLAAPAMATPMTYAVNGRQYVVVAAGGNQLFSPDFDDSLVAFTLRD